VTPEFVMTSATFFILGWIARRAFVLFVIDRKLRAAEKRLQERQWNGR
jgi:hypothetical protein